MARNFNFQATLKLNSSEFKKGVKDIQKSLNGLKSSFLSFAGALGAGLGFSQLVGSVKDVATQLSVAKNTLKNVSTGLGEYGESMIWLQNISNKYGQDIMSLTNNFAKFRAAAADSKLSIEQLRDIYESLTRAAGAYHMTSSQATDAMLAVTQMMSKGRVAAEELRRQLGNSLPGAFNLMAKAAQVAGISTNGTTAELEDLMKKGKVAAEDILPSFAKVLNEATRSADFDSLQSSLNRLKNSFTNLVDKGGFEKSLKSLVDIAAKAIDKIGDNFTTLKQVVSSALIGIFSTKGIMNAFSKGDAIISKNESIYNREIDRYERMKKMAAAYSNGKSIIELDDKSATIYLNKLASVEKQYQKIRELSKEFDFSFIDGEDGLEHSVNTEFLKSIQQYAEKTKKSYEELEKSLGIAFGSDNLQSAKKYTAQMGILQKIGVGLKSVFKQVGVALKAMLPNIILTAIISGISYVIQKINEANKKARELRDWTKNVLAEVNKNANNPSDELVSITALRDALETAKKSGEAIEDNLSLLKKVNEALGRTGDKAFGIKNSYDEIIAACNNWIEALKRVAKQEAVINALKDQYNQKIMLQSENEQLAPKTKETVTKAYGMGYTTWEEPTNEAIKASKVIAENNKKIEAINKTIDTLMGLTDEEGKKYLDEDTLKGLYEVKGKGSGAEQPVSEPSKVIEKYNKSLDELNNQYENGAISTEEYDKQLAKVTQDAWEALAAFDAWDKVLKQLSGKDKDTANFIKDNTDALTFKANFNEIGNEINNEVENYFEEFAKQGEEDIKNAIEKWKSAFDEYLDVKDKEGKLSKVKQRDSTYDYMYNPNRKSGEILSELQVEAIKGTLDIKLDNIDDWEDLKSELEEGLSEGKFGDFAGQISGILDEIIDKIKELKGEATTMQHVLNLNELQTEINDLKKDILETSWDSFTQLAEGTDRIVKGFQTLKETMNDVDSTPFERMMAIVNLFIQTMETLCTITKTFNMITQLSDKIKEKSYAKQIAGNAGVIISEEAKATAESTAAVAGAASSQAAIPIVGPILAAAAVAGIIALLLSSKGKFANGGIVNYGSTSGDKTLARVNKGEGILTAEGVKNLQSLYNNQGGVGGQVQFKIKGSDLIGVINNEQSRRRG